MNILHTIAKKITVLIRKQSKQPHSSAENFKQLQARVAQLESSLTLILQRVVQLNLKPKDAIQNSTFQSSVRTNPQPTVYLVKKRDSSKNKTFTERLDLLTPAKDPTYH